MHDLEIYTIDQLRGQDYWDTYQAATDLSMAGMTTIQISTTTKHTRLSRMERCEWSSNRNRMRNILYV